MKVKPSFFDYDKGLTNLPKRVEKIGTKNLAYACGCGALRVGTNLNNLKGAQDFFFENGKAQL